MYRRKKLPGLTCEQKLDNNVSTHYLRSNQDLAYIYGAPGANLIFRVWPDGRMSAARKKE
jgi:hypothetical protein